MDEPTVGPLELARIAARGLASLVGRAPAAPTQTPEGPVVVSPDTLRERRIPPRQVQTRKWPVLHAGPTPMVDLATWDLRVEGLVESPTRWTWPEFRALARTTVRADMHCVTRWSRLDISWEGVSIASLLTAVRPRPDAAFVLVHGDGGYSTNLPLAEFAAEDCLLAWSHDGRPLDADHWAPLRLVVPRLYAWKSAKWVRRIEFLAADKPGFWERNGYHNHGDPWALNAAGTDSAERFS